MTQLRDDNKLIIFFYNFPQLALNHNFSQKKTPKNYEFPLPANCFR